MGRKIANLDFFDRVSVLVIGDVMLDRYLWGDIRRISPEAPVPVVEIERETHTAGGAANVALNLHALGVRCELCGIVGDDAAGAELRTLLGQRNIAFDSRFVRSEAPTITKTRIIAQRQQVCRLDRESDLAAYSIAEPELLTVVLEKAKSYDAVLLSDYAKGGITQPLLDGLRRVRTDHKPFLALDPKPTRALEIEGLDLLTPNRSEALQLLGLPPHGHGALGYEEIAAKLMARHHPKCLVMTLSEHGMLLRASTGKSQRFPTFAREVADVSGAGDTVAAVLTAALAAGRSAAQAVHFANAAAGVVVGKLGTATVNREELIAAIDAGWVGNS